MNTPLSSGVGGVSLEQEMSIVLTTVASEMSMLSEIIDSIAGVVHHHNRNAPSDDYLSIAFPDFNDRVDTPSNINRIGRSVSLFGSKDAIERAYQDTRIQFLENRSELAHVSVSNLEAGDSTGVAFVRDRRREKLTAAARRRMEQRSAKYGMTGSENPSPVDPSRVDADVVSFFRPGRGRSIFFRMVHDGPVGRTAVVSTYGLSQSSGPSFLPVKPTDQTSTVPNADDSDDYMRFFEDAD